MMQRGRLDRHNRRSSPEPAALATSFARAQLQPHEGSTAQPHEASQPQLTSQQQQALRAARRAFSLANKQHLGAQQSQHESQQPQLGSQHESAQPQLGSAAQPHEGSAAQPHETSQPQHGSQQHALRAARRAFILANKPHLGAQQSQQGSQHDIAQPQLGSQAIAQPQAGSLAQPQPKNAFAFPAKASARASDNREERTIGRLLNRKGNTFCRSVGVRASRSRLTRIGMAPMR